MPCSREEHPKSVALIELNNNLFFSSLTVKNIFAEYEIE